MKFDNAQFETSFGVAKQLMHSDMPEVAFSGRSNVGKSSLLNRLMNRKSLARVSSMPGKTVTINFFKLDSFRLVDLPGYGYAKRGKKEQDKFEQMITSYILGREQMTLLFLLVDARLEPQRIDLEFIEWLGENGVPFALVFTKADKISKGRLGGNVQHYLKVLSKQWEELPPYFITSSENRMGRQELLQYIGEINEMVRE